MKQFDDFIQSITSNADFFANIEKEMMTKQEIVNAPHVGARIHAETAIIAIAILKKYHEWLNE